MNSHPKNPLEAYIASKQSRPWLKNLWNDDMVRWTRKRIQAADIDSTSIPADVKNWYSHTVAKPGYDYRLGYLPPVPFLLDVLLGEGRQKTFDELESLFLTDTEFSVSTLASLVRLADFSAGHIEELAASYFRVEGVQGWQGERSGDQEVLQALLANPNADSSWLEEVFERRLKEIQRGEVNASNWNVFTAIGWNPSITSDLADKLAGNELVTKVEPVLSSLVWNPVFDEDIYFKHFAEGAIYPSLSEVSSRRPLLWHGNVARHKTGNLMVLGGDSDAPEGTVEFSVQEEHDIKDAYKLNTLVHLWGLGLSTQDTKKSRWTPFETLNMGSPSNSALSLDLMYLDPSQEEYRIEASNALKVGRTDDPMDLFQFLAAANIHHVLPLSRLTEEFGDDAKDVPAEWLEELI